LRGAFVVSQVAISLVLLVGAGLLLNSFYRLLHVEPGFDPRNLLTMEYRLPKNRYAKGEQQWAFHKEVVERVSQVPGVESAAVVGVVGDAKQYDIGEQQRPQIYTAYAQNPHIFGTLVVRARVEPLSLAKSVREAVWSVDPDQPVWKVRTVEYLLNLNVADRRFVLYLMACFAALALMLTALGIYGVVSYTVAQRTHEIGIRVALGAQGRDVLRLVLRHGMGLALA